MKPIELEKLSGQEEKEIQLSPHEEKVLQIKSIANLIINFIAYNDFKLAEKGTTIQIPAGVMSDKTVGTKAVTCKAANIFKTCVAYTKATSFNTDNFEKFLAEQIEILKAKTKPVDSFWKKRSPQTAKTHENLLSLLENQYHALIFLKKIPMKEEKPERVSDEKLTVGDIKKNCLERIVEATGKSSATDLMSIRFFANQLLQGKSGASFTFERFSEQATTMIKRNQTTSIETFQRSPNQAVYQEISKILNSAKSQIVKKESESPALVG